MHNKMEYTSYIAFFVTLSSVGAVLTADTSIIYQDFNVTFEPESIQELKENFRTIVSFNITCDNEKKYTNHSVTFISERETIATITKNKTQNLDTLNCNYSNTFSIEVTGNRLGKTVFSMYLHHSGLPPTDKASVKVADYSVIVIRVRRVVDDIFRYGIITFSVLVYLGFGCQIEFSVIKEILKKPIAPAIGCLCQFIIMPLLGFGIGRLLQLDNNLAFGLLAMAASPGGGGSNVWANLLGGSLDLSLCMTFISTICSLFMMPLWMFAFSRFLLDESVTVPYATIARTLLTIAAPCIVGSLIRFFLPKVGKFIVKLVRPVSLVMILFILSFGTYVNVYMYGIMAEYPLVIPAAILMPYLGFLLGFLIALACRLGKVQAGTIGIETGYQNASIPIIMLQGNFPQPDGDLGAVMPTASVLFTPIPLIFIYLYQVIRHCCKKKKENSDSDDGENQENNESIFKSNIELTNKPVPDSVSNGNALAVTEKEVAKNQVMPNSNGIISNGIQNKAFNEEKGDAIKEDENKDRETIKL